MINSVEYLGDVWKTSIYRTAKIMIVLNNRLHCVYAQISITCISSMFAFKTKLVNICNQESIQQLDKHNSNNLDIAVTIAIGL